MWTGGSALLSCGIAVKMSVILAIPAVGVMLLQAIGSERAITQAMLIGQTQVNESPSHVQVTLLLENQANEYDRASLLLNL